MLRMNCLYWPKSPLRTTPILITYSLCGCTAESRFSPLILSAVVLRRAYLSKCSHHQAPPHAPHAPPHAPHAPPHAPHAPPHAPLGQCLPPWFSLQLYCGEPALQCCHPPSCSPHSSSCSALLYGQECYCSLHITSQALYT